VRKKTVTGKTASLVTRNKSHAGRPKKQLSKKIVEGMAKLGCSNIEIASLLECSVDTLTRNFAEILDKGRNGLKMKLRKAQITAAGKGNVAMLIWLGKQYLGQADKRDLTITDRITAVRLAIDRHRKEFPRVSESERLEWFSQETGIDKTELVSEANN
jgi:hypothetical protein